MPRSLVVLLMFSMAAVATAAAVFKAHRVAALKDDPGEWRNSLSGLAILALAVLLTNGLVFVDWAQFDAFESGVPDRDVLLESQIFLLLGTASLMWLTVTALDDPVVREASNPTAGVGRALSEIVGRLAIRFW